MGTLGKKPQPGEPLPATPQAKPNGDTSRSLLDIELALADHFNWKKNVIAFNVLGISATLPLDHECDMLVVTPSGYLTEVEIKRSYDDFCAEFKKRHHHASSVPMKDFLYCVPAGILEKVVKKLEEQKIIPSGILTYDENLEFRQYGIRSNEDTPENRQRAEELRKEGRSILLLFNGHGGAVRIVDPNLSNHPLFLEQQLEIARLGAMRQVALRRKISELQQRGPVNPDEKLLTKIAQMEVLLHEYRKRFKEETGQALDEKEILFG